MQNNNDWFVNLKMDVVRLRVVFQMLKEDIVFLVMTNSWILEDMNLFESYTKLQEMVEVSENDLTSLTQELNDLEITSLPFLVEDIICEFNFVKENIDLEQFYLFNMSLYMFLIDDYSLNALEIEKRCSSYVETDSWCYEQMEMNNEQLKILKKERRDYVE